MNDTIVAYNVLMEKKSLAMRHPLGNQDRDGQETKRLMKDYRRCNMMDNNNQYGGMNEDRRTNQEAEFQPRSTSYHTEVPNYIGETMKVERPYEQPPFPYGEPKPVKVHKRRGGALKAFMLLLVGALLGSSISLGLGYYYLPEILTARGINFNQGQQSVNIEVGADYTVFSAVAKKAMSSVVGITTMTTQRTFFGVTQTPGVGTGVIVDARGYILTNSHVVDDGYSNDISVTLYDGEQLAAQVVWQDSNLDLAVIKVETTKDLPVAELGDSDSLEVGDIAVAIGNPLGLTFERTLTQGVISGLNRNVTINSQTTIENLIQTDASINPGNSGGPLLNAKGQVIGINTAKIQTGEGLGFAIPINTAKPIVQEIIENGQFTRVVMGIRGINVETFEASTGVDLQVDTGVYVVEIIPDSPVEKGGMAVGDVIIKIGEKKITTMGTLQKELYQYRPGDTAAVTVMRNGREMVINITFE